MLTPQLRTKFRLKPAGDEVVASDESTSEPPPEPDPESRVDPDQEATAAAPWSEIPRFHARSRAKALAAELTAPQERVGRLGLLSVVELDERKQALTQEVEGLEAKLTSEREHAAAPVARETTESRRAAEEKIAQLRVDEGQLTARLAELREDVVVTEESAVLQEVGVYEHRHPLSDAVAYQAELKRLQDQIKVMARADGGAILASTDWTVNNSRTQGRTMVRDYSKLVLRAYNADADNLVRALKPDKLQSAIDRLAKTSVTIEKLGRMMNIRISRSYHALRIRELELIADYLEKRAEEKEREAAERDRLREEKRVQQELAHERTRLEKEHQHYTNVIARLIEQSKLQDAEEHRAVLDRSRKQLRTSTIASRTSAPDTCSHLQHRRVRRANNQDWSDATDRPDRAHPRTRRPVSAIPLRHPRTRLLRRRRRTRDNMHQRLADRRVNWVNRRREFFYATPEEAKQHLMELSGQLLEYTDEAEALEYRQSLNHAQALAEQVAGATAPDRPQAEEQAPPALAVPTQIGQ